MLLRRSSDVSDDHQVHPSPVLKAQLTENGFTALHSEAVTRDSHKRKHAFFEYFLQNGNAQMLKTVLGGQLCLFSYLNLEEIFFIKTTLLLLSQDT